MNREECFLGGDNLLAFALKGLLPTMLMIPCL